MASLSDYSSRIQNLYIELHDYKYFHGPSDIHTIDERFIGRKAIIDKLKAILTNSESKSGAYMITGYRGMGKSSFVSKVLADINPLNQFGGRLRYFRIFLLLVLLSLLRTDEQIGVIGVEYLLRVFLVLSGLMLLLIHMDRKVSDRPAKTGRTPKSASDPGAVRNAQETIPPEGEAGSDVNDGTRKSEMRGSNSPEVKKTAVKRYLLEMIFSACGIGIMILMVLAHSVPDTIIGLLDCVGLVLLFNKFKRFEKNIEFFPIGTKGGSNRLRLFAELFRVRHSNALVGRLRIVLQDLFLAGLCYGIGLIAVLLFFHDSTLVFLLGAIALAALACVNFAYHAHVSEDVDAHRSSGGDMWSRLKNITGNIIWRLKKSIKSYFSHSNLLYVWINLSYDELKEIDILRLVCRGILSRYRDKMKTSNMLELPIKTLSFILVLLAVGIVYYNQSIYAINYSIKEQTGVLMYFPSQGWFTIAGKTNQSSFYAKELYGEPENFYAGSLKRMDTNLVIQSDSVYYRPASDTTFLGMLRIVSFHLDAFLQLAYSKGIEKCRTKLVPFFVSSDSSYEGQGLVRRMFDFNLRNEFWLLPLRMDYLFWIYVLFVWISTRYIGRLRIPSLVTNRHILDRLQDLNNRIEAQITLENTKERHVNGKIGGAFQRKMQQAYPRADEREIERLLRETLLDVESIPRILGRPEFVVIFDELDKIEPQRKSGIREKDEEDDIQDAPSLLNGSSTDQLRNRKQTILRILSNMKGFLTTTNCKFIFIAGREIYDAALADVSDRDFFISSIFNQVIYVDSFLKDTVERSNADITHMTELYVCQFLLPLRFKRFRDLCNLKTYNEYLKNVFGGAEPGSEEERIARLRREKIIHTLHCFITYLTYRSNGAPKKITQYFEEYITPLPAGVTGENDGNLVLGSHTGSLYLSFGYYAQLTFGMSTYLMTPFFLSLNKSIRDYGDKLLVSTSFLVDHIYKFHRFGFAWRNLELTPEVVNINKPPQLRELIGEIVKFLQGTHIRMLDNGLYNFKFHKKVSDEITLLSKINEHESAAFNFTLDESLAIKRHYRHYLRTLEKLYRPHFSASDSPEFIRSISFVHAILGDLHLYDEDYDNAIMEFMESIQLFGDGKFRDMSIDMFVALVRNTLKLGLTFERKRTYESALMVYGKLASRVAVMKDIKPGDIDIYYLFNKQKEASPTIANEESLLENYNTKEYLEKYFETGDFTKEKEYLYFRFMLLSGLRLLYQPLVAKISILEKTTPLGITALDLRRMGDELRFICSNPEKEQTIFIEAEVKQKIGDVLFYKNGPLLKPPAEKPKTTVEFNAFNPQHCYCWLLDPVCCSNDRVREILDKKDVKTPCFACGLYIESLCGLMEKYLGGKPAVSNALILQLLDSLDTNDSSSDIPNETIKQTTASILSSLGDAFLSCTTNEEILEEAFVEVFLNIVDARNIKPPALSPTQPSSVGEAGSSQSKRDLFIEYFAEKMPSKLEEVFLYYYLSALFYRRAGDLRECTFQFIKILYVFREYQSRMNSKGDRTSVLSEKILEKIGDVVITRIIKWYYRTYDCTHHIECNKIKTSFTVSVDPTLTDTSKDTSLEYRKYSSIMWDIHEVLLLWDELNFLANNKLRNDIKWLKGKMSGPYDSITNMYNRVPQLKMRAKINYELLVNAGLIAASQKEENTINVREIRFDKLLHAESAEKLFNEFHAQVEERPASNMDYLVHFVADSLYCFAEIIRVCSIYGITYTVTHSFLGSAHEKMAEWCGLYEQLLVYLENGHPGPARDGTKPDDMRKRSLRMLQETIKYAIGSDNVMSLSSIYHNEMALKHYRAALEMHREGRAYKERIQDMIYLDGDTQDNVYHFFAALERYQINSGRIRERIKGLRLALDKSAAYRTSEQ